MEVHRGEVFYADLSPVVGSEQGGVRPVLIVQNEIGNRHSPTVIAAAITSRLDKARLPTHINIRAADTGLAAVSRMKGHWFYLIRKFEGADKLEKQLRKAREPWEYEVVVNQLFTLPMT